MESQKEPMRLAGVNWNFRLGRRMGKWSQSPPYFNVPSPGPLPLAHSSGTPTLHPENTLGPVCQYLAPSILSPASFPTKALFLPSPSPSLLSGSPEDGISVNVNGLLCTVLTEASARGLL